MKECKIFDEEDPNGLSAHGLQSGESDNISTSQEENQQLKPTKQLPCRIALKVSGVEAFLYNRSPAYDAILEALQQKEKSDAADASEKMGKEGLGYSATEQRSSSDTTTTLENELRVKETRNTPEPEVSRSDCIGTDAKKAAPPSFLRLLPIAVEVNKGAAVLGNDNTKSIISARFDSASGTFDASRAGSLDLYKILIGFDVVHPYIQMKPNVDYKLPQLSEASALKSKGRSDEMDLNRSARSGGFIAKLRKFMTKRIWLPFKMSRMPMWSNASSESIAPAHRKSSPSEKFKLTRPSAPEPRWVGLARYLGDNDRDEHQEWDPIEYAKSSVLADIKSVGLVFFWEIPGFVPDPKPTILSENINGTPPPEYGMDLFVRGGQINYGPWADRHRVNLQQIFFPGSFTDAVAAVALKPGETRISTIFKLRLTVEDETVLRIPFREASKDWRWKGRAAAMGEQGKGTANRPKVKSRRRRSSIRHRKSRAAVSTSDVRPFAWFDIAVASNTVIDYEMDMIPRATGYENKLQVDVSGLQIYSSLNHALLWRSGLVAMKCDLSNALAWNEIRKWLFDITIHSLDLFLLRDHTFLLVDLITDWSAGPLPDFLTFVPFRYLLKVHFQDFKMYLNTNDANIINNSEDLDDNEFVILYGRMLDADLVIPLDRFRPISKDIKFDVTALDLGFEMRMPSKNTLNTLLKDKNVAQLESVVLHGIYTACSEIKPGFTDTLNLEVTGKSFTISFFGFLARHLAKIKDNYFGDSVHFRTLEEYQDLLEQKAAGTAIDVPSPKSNDLDVILDISAENLNILLPVNMYEVEEHVRIRVDTADVDLRVTSYYLELMVNSTPLELDFIMRLPDNEFRVFDRSNTQLFLDGVKVYGHRLFGLPPLEPAYVSNWDIHAGSIRGECSCEFVQKLVAAGQSIALTINDAENAQPVPQAVILHDSTFVRFRCSLIHVWCIVDENALLFSTGLIGGSFNDWASQAFSQRLNMTVPDLTLACVDGKAALHRRNDLLRQIETYAYVKTSVIFNMVQRDLHFSDQRAFQQDHIRTQDDRAPRAHFLLHQEPPAVQRSPQQLVDSKPVSLPLPSLPNPLNGDITTSSSNFESMFQASDAEFSKNNRLLDDVNPITNQPRKLADTTASDTFMSDQHGVSFTSCFREPYFPLHSVELDLTEVPHIDTVTSDAPRIHSTDRELDLDEFDDDAIHTSFMVTAESGIMIFCKPEAVRMVSNLLERTQPKGPIAMLDRFQFTTINEVLSSYSRAHGNNAIVDASVRVPHLHIRFVNTFASEDKSDLEPRSDRYNLLANELAILFRVKTVPQRPDELDATSMHASLAYVAISAQEGSDDLKEEDAALQLVIDDIMLWLVNSEQMSIQTSFRKLAVAMASKKVEYLASLIHRTTMLVDGFQADFVSVLAQPEKRLRYLVYELVKLGEESQDPAFLTRPSYAMRASPDHIRNSDSWKILSRLRYVYQSLSHEEQVRLMAVCLDGDVKCPHDSEMYVMTTLNLWRSWDAMMVAESFAMRILYGSTSEATKLHDRSSIPVGIAIRAGALKLVIDPGQNQNKFSIQDLAIRLAITPRSPPSVMEIFKEFDDKKTTVIQIHSSRITLGLNWRICNLIDHILTLFEQKAPGQFPINDDLNHESDAPTTTPESEEVHIIFVTDSARIALQTPNLHQLITCESLKLSATGSGWNPGAEEVVVNVLTSAKSASTTMRGHDRILLHTSVTAPSFGIAYEQTVIDDKYLNTLKVVGDSREVTFEIKDEILGLIEVANLVVSEEAKYIYHLVKTHSQAQIVSSDPSRLPGIPVRERLPLQINLALFLNVYTINVALLNDLTYTTIGRVARLSVTPDLQMASTYQIDFDLKGQTHRVSNEARPDSRTVSELAMPPINGTIRLLHTPELATISATVSIERIQFEAGDVYGLMNALGTTQVSTAIEAIKADAATVQRKVVETFPSSRATKTVKPSEINRPVIFDGNIVLAGFSVSADVPSSLDDTRNSGMLFEIQSFYVRAANRSKNEQVPLPFPEIRIALKQICLELRQSQGGEYRDCGKMTMGALFTCTMYQPQSSELHRKFRLSIIGPEVDLYVETAPIAADVFSHLQSRMKDVDLSMERKYLRRLRHLDQRNRSTKKHVSYGKHELEPIEDKIEDGSSGLTSSFAFDLQLLQISYILRDSVPRPVGHVGEDLVLTLKAVNLLARGEAEARLSIEDLEVALVPPGVSLDQRARNSALLPEVVINVAHQTTKAERKLAFHAAGKALDLQLDPQFILPASDIERSITRSSKLLQAAAANLRVTTASSGGGFPAQKLMGSRKLSSLLVSAEFAGAVLSLRGRNKEDLHKASIAALHLENVPQHGRYGQFANDHASTTASLKAPGVAFRVQYTDNHSEEASLNVEVRVDGSNNVVYPAVVPLILQISDSVKHVVRDPEPENLPATTEEHPEPSPGDADNPSTSNEQKSEDSTVVGADPQAILGKIKLNMGLRICKQEFSLSCQPIAKVAAYAKLEDIYITINSVDSNEHGHFFAASAVFKGFNASLRHVYSREGTFSFDIDSIVLSLMNSKHISGVGGISAILNINPSRAEINARQLQDVLLFREIWLPPEIRNAYDEPTSPTTEEPQEYFVQRYKQIAATTVFPWNATVAIAELTLDLDLGQVIGKSSFHVRNLWASSKKTSSSQQNLCVGMDGIDMTSSGRMSGFIELEKVKVRTSIAWSSSGDRVEHTPLIQASIGFDRLRAKAAFDYQAFAVVDVSSFEFIMYNVRDIKRKRGDRLVAILDGDKVRAYCIASSAALGLSLFQAFERLIQEKQASYNESLRDIERFLRRKESVVRQRDIPKLQSTILKGRRSNENESDMTLSLHTDVVVTLRSVDVGCFPSTLLDHQVLKADATDIQARFAATLEDNQIHTGLGLTLGQLRVALAAVPHPSVPRKLGEMTIDEVANNAIAARGGVILRVPKVLATMQTWQPRGSKQIDYIFKSTFEGKIDVGWNYSRISFIRGMWATHARTLASRLGKPLPESAVKIHGAPEIPGDSITPNEESKPPIEQQKITAVVNLPLSSYTYHALEPSIIDTPQLRDMGEATPPLEWIGLHRDRLPNVTHQIVIVALLEIAREVEEAYSRILGSA